MRAIASQNCRETVGSRFLPRRIKMSRRALWEYLGVVSPHLPVGKNSCVVLLCDLAKTD